MTWTRRLRLRPAKDCRVSHADGRLFKAEGELVPMAPFYDRLLMAGDLEPVPRPRLPAKSKTVPKLPEGQSLTERTSA